MNAFSLSGLIIAICCAGASLLALFNPKIALNRLCALTNITVGIWGVGAFLIGLERDPEKALFFWRASHVGVIFIPVSFLHFVCEFLNHPKKTLIIPYIIAFFFLAILFSGHLINNVSLVFNSFYYEGHPSTFFYIIFSAYWFYEVIHCHYLLIINMNKIGPIKNNKTKYYFLATAPAFTGGLTCFLPAFGIDIYPIGNLLVPFYPIFLTYAILRHNLIDIKIILKKSLVYTILVTFITILFFLVILLTERLFQNIFGYTSLLGSLVAAAVLALAFIPLKNRIQTFVDKYFFRGTYPEIAEQNDQLRETLSRQEKFKAVATLASGIAHEIKNPVTVLQTFLEHLPRKKDDPAFIEKFSRISAQELGRMEDLIRQLLDFAKPSPLELEETDLNDLLKDTLALIAGEAGKHHIETRTSWTSASIRLRADQRQLKQAFLNILLNAIEAMPQGGILSVETSRSSGHTPRISIRDTGSGIAEEDLKHIFEPFFSRKTSGTGLGLAITKDIIEKHDGEIRVSSSVGSGTTFVIEFKKANAL